ncbi:DUF397 domain-containing protein [Nocardia sp. NPDC003693]
MPSPRRTASRSMPPPQSMKVAHRHPPKLSPVRENRERRGGPALTFGPRAWDAFTAALRAGNCG